MVDVIATERGYFGSIRREPGERFSLPDIIWKDEARRPKWVRLARSAGKADADPSEKKPAARAAKPPVPPEPIGNGVQEALGGPDPDWLRPDTPGAAASDIPSQNSSQPGD